MRSDFIPWEVLESRCNVQQDFCVLFVSERNPSRIDERAVGEKGMEGMMERSKEC